MPEDYPQMNEYNSSTQFANDNDSSYDSDDLYNQLTDDYETSGDEYIPDSDSDCSMDLFLSDDDESDCYMDLFEPEDCEPDLPPQLYRLDSDGLEYIPSITSQNLRYPDTPPDTSILDEIDLDSNPDSIDGVEQEDEEISNDMFYNRRDPRDNINRPNQTIFNSFFDTLDKSPPTTTAEDNTVPTSTSTCDNNPCTVIHKNCQILTTVGYKNAGDLNIGEELLSSRGEIIRVERLQNMKHQPSFLLNLQNSKFTIGIHLNSKIKLKFAGSSTFIKNKFLFVRSYCQHHPSFVEYSTFEPIRSNGSVYQDELNTVIERLMKGTKHQKCADKGSSPSTIWNLAYVGDIPDKALQHIREALIGLIPNRIEKNQVINGLLFNHPKGYRSIPLLHNDLNQFQFSFEFDKLLYFFGTLAACQFGNKFLIRKDKTSCLAEVKSVLESRGYGYKMEEVNLFFTRYISVYTDDPITDFSSVWYYLFSNEISLGELLNFISGVIDSKGRYNNDEFYVDFLTIGDLNKNILDVCMILRLLKKTCIHFRESNANCFSIAIQQNIWLITSLTKREDIRDALKKKYFKDTIQISWVPCYLDMIRIVHGDGNLMSTNGIELGNYQDDQ